MLPAGRSADRATGVCLVVAQGRAVDAAGVQAGGEPRRTRRRRVPLELAPGVGVDVDARRRRTAVALTPAEPIGTSSAPRVSASRPTLGRAGAADGQAQSGRGVGAGSGRGRPRPGSSPWRGGPTAPASQLAAPRGRRARPSPRAALGEYSRVPSSGSTIQTRSRGEAHGVVGRPPPRARRRRGEAAPARPAGARASGGRPRRLQLGGVIARPGGAGRSASTSCAGGVGQLTGELVVVGGGGHSQ